MIFFVFFFGGKIKKVYICVSKPCCSEIGKLNTKNLTRPIGMVQWRAAPSGMSSRHGRLQRTSTPQILFTGVFSTNGNMVCPFSEGRTTYYNRYAITDMRGGAMRKGIAPPRIFFPAFFLPFCRFVAKEYVTKLTIERCSTYYSKLLHFL